MDENQNYQINPKYLDSIPSRAELLTISVFADSEEEREAAIRILRLLPPATKAEEAEINTAMWTGRFDHLIGNKAKEEMQAMVDGLPAELDMEFDPEKVTPPTGTVWVPREPGDPPQAAPEDPVVPRPEVPTAPPGVSQTLFRQLALWPPKPDQNKPL